MSSAFVSRRQLGNGWPFTLPRGFLKRERGALLFLYGRRTYALNGVARQRMEDGWTDILESDIWMEDERTGARKSLTPLFDRLPT